MDMSNFDLPGAIEQVVKSTQIKELVKTQVGEQISKVTQPEKNLVWLATSFTDFDELKSFLKDHGALIVSLQSFHVAGENRPYKLIYSARRS